MPPIERSGGEDTAFPGATDALNSTPANKEWLPVTHSGCQPFGKFPYVGNGPGRLAPCDGSRLVHFNQFPGFCGWLGSCSSMFSHEQRTYRAGAVGRTQTDVRKPMMKRQVKELDNQLIPRVEGRLAGAFVLELELPWQAARASQPHRRISVDLKSVTCI